MKKLTLTFTALGAFVAFSAGSPASATSAATTSTDDGIELACRPGICRRFEMGGGYCRATRKEYLERYARQE